MPSPLSAPSPAKGISAENSYLATEGISGEQTTTFAADVFTNKPTTPPSTWSPAQLESWKNDVGNYLAAVMHLDYQLGRVLDALEASEQDDNTMIVFFSDHGYELWSHGHMQKFTLWEQCAAVPLLICDAPSELNPAGAIVTTPVSVMDVGPTLLDMAGLPVPSHHAGVSLKAAVEGGAAPDRMILTAWYSGASGRTDTHRITVYADGSTEYFNVIADPWTQDNLAPENPPGMTADRAELLATAREWGVMIVEEGVDVSAPTPFAVHIGAAEQDKSIVGRAFVAYANLKPEHYPRGRKKIWVQPGVQGDVIRVPFGFNDIGVPHQLAGSKNEFTIYATAGDDVFDIEDMQSGFSVNMHLGEGDDRIEDIYGDFVVYAGPGNDYVWSWRSSQQQWHGGPGNDTLRGGNASDLLTGGPGDDLLQGIGGNDTLIAGPGNDTLQGGAGNDTLILDAGSNTAGGGTGADTFIVHRTGLLQTISDFDAADTIDLSDWANIGPVDVAQAGGDVTITAALERIVVNSATAATVEASITGVSVS